MPFFPTDFWLSILILQLLFETGRRELLGARNRRLLGFTKNVRELEEQNLALVDQLHMAQQEIVTLHSQLTNVRHGKHQACYSFDLFCCCKITCFYLLTRHQQREAIAKIKHI